MGRKQTHGLRYHPIYAAYDAIISRCYNKNVPAFKNYGGRGITICEEWKNDRMKFISWAFENGWQDGLHLDRINNDGNYTPDNCRFVTRKVNNNNTRSNRFITYKDQSKTLAEWADLSGKSYYLIRDRLRMGWDIERALCSPLQCPK